MDFRSLYPEPVRAQELDGYSQYIFVNKLIFDLVGLIQDSLAVGVHCDDGGAN